MAIYIFGIKVFLDTSPAVANASDIGLYDDAENGSNKVFRWITNDISSYTPTYSWKTGVLKPTPFKSISESVDLLDGGNIPTIGGTSTSVVNTISYGGSYTQFDKILSDNDINIFGLKCEIVQFEVSGGSLVSADGSTIFRGICGEVTWTEKQLNIPVETALIKRKANLATIINESNYPNASTDILGDPVPVTFGEFLPEFDDDGNPLYNGYSKFVRVANKETSYVNVDRRTMNEALNIEMSVTGDLKEITIFPVIGDDGDDPPIMYEVKLGDPGYEFFWWQNGSPLNSGTHRLTYFEGQYIFVTEGTGTGKYRKIEKAEVNIGAGSPLPASTNATIEFTLADYFEETLAGNSTATETDQSWVKIIDINRMYRADVWKCKDYLDQDGNIIDSGLNLYSYFAQSKAKVTLENTDAAIETLPVEFYRLPQYAYEDFGNNNKNLIDIDVALFENNPDSMNSFLVLPVRNIELFSGDPNDWFSDVPGIGNAAKYENGLYTSPIDPVMSVTFAGDIGNSGRAIDKQEATKWNPIYQMDMSVASLKFIQMTFLSTFDLPEYPKKFSFDSLYLGIYMNVSLAATSTQSAGSVYIRHRKFMGNATVIKTAPGSFDRTFDLNMRDVLDQHYLDNATNKNKFFYYVVDDSTTYYGHTEFEFSGIGSEENYNAIRNCIIAVYSPFSDSSNFTGTTSIKMYELCAMFKKSVSIGEAIYSPHRGRIYNGTWGAIEGSSSSSSISSSSTSSDSPSSSSSSQSSPSSSSSSSQSSPSSSSSSSESCSMGVGRKNACAMINNPIDILEHTLRLQNWSEEGEVKEWGKEYPRSPLIDVSTSEGGFDYEDLDDIKDIRPARQILNYNKAFTDEISRSICKQFFLCNYQNPATGKESVTYVADKSLTAPTTTITLSDIIGGLSEVKMPQAKGIYCEPVIRYCKNNASGKYEKVIQITNSNASSYQDGYVIGLSGDDAELLWTRANKLWQAYRQIEKVPTDLSNHDWIVNDSDAYWYLDTWLTWMGAINTDGTTSGVTFDPKKRITFSVPYETGKDWFLSQHHKLQLPHQTNNQAIEFVIEKITKDINSGSEKVKVQVILYGDADEIALYIQDTYIQGTLINDVQDDVDTQTDDPTNAEDWQDIT